MSSDAPKATLMLVMLPTVAWRDGQLSGERVSAIADVRGLMSSSAGGHCQEMPMQGIATAGDATSSILVTEPAGRVSDLGPHPYAVASPY